MVWFDDLWLCCGFVCLPDLVDLRLRLGDVVLDGYVNSVDFLVFMIFIVLFH